MALRESIPPAILIFPSAYSVFSVLTRGRVDSRKHPFLGGAKSLVGPVAHFPKRCTICCTFAFKFWPFDA